MGSKLSKNKEKKNKEVIDPLNVPVKIQMEFIITYWLRNCGQIFPMEVIKVIIDLNLFQSAFAAVHELRLKHGNEFSKGLVRHYKSKTNEPGQEFDYRYKYIFKFLLVGGYHPGKTSILLRCTDPSFRGVIPDHIRGIQIERFKSINIEGNNIKLLMTDNGPFDFDEIDGIIMIYDITDRHSFKWISHWNETAKKGYGMDFILPDKILIANKRDLEEQRAVSIEQGQDLAKALGINDYMETSARTGWNVEVAINKLAARVLLRIQRVNNPWLE